MQKRAFLFLVFTALLTACNSEQRPRLYTPIIDLTDADGNIIDTACSNPLPPNTYNQPTAADWPTVRDMKLGALYDGTNTTFQFFAPTAQQVDVVLYDTALQNYSSPSAVIAMARDGVGAAGWGVWSTAPQTTAVARPPNAAGGGRYYYRYRINCMQNYENKTISESDRYINDPYALASAGSNGHSIIIDTQWTVSQVFSGWNNATDGISSDIGGANWFGTARPKTAEYIIYEAHVDDFTGSVSCLQSHAGSSCKTALQSYYSGQPTLSAALGATSGDNFSGKYAGFEAMSNYLKNDLGVNAVHLMPLHESSNDNKDNPESYSWGYLPSLFFAPESSYSTYCSRANAGDACSYAEARAGYQVLELKRLIKKLHSQGIAVIFDVVLNHTSNAFNYLYQAEPYGRYYFRTNGLNWANIGTGNQLFDDRNQRPFAYKYILDNIKYWVKHYHVDGFRFDLAVGTSEQTLRDIQNMINDANTPGTWSTSVPPSATEASTLIDSEFLRSSAAETYASDGQTRDNFNNVIKLPNFMTGENWLDAQRHGFMVQSDWASPNFAGELTSDYRGFSQWNDYFRESVKKFIQGDADAQYTNRTKTALYFSKGRDDGIWQGVSKNPLDTLNYIESHDEETVARAVLDSKSKSAMGITLLLTAHGVPMLYEGQEVMRNRERQNQSKSINNIDWQLAQTNADFLAYTATLAKLRRACPALCYASDPTNVNSNFDGTTPNQTISLFTKGTACAGFTGADAGFINGKSEFRILANMTAGSQSFTVESGGAWWRAVAASTGGNDNTNCSDPGSAVLRYVNGTGVNQISSWGATNNTWSLPCYSTVVLVKQ
ncbi:MAG: Glycogen debranching enzyme [Turneriella sp.]|nr:Glycogen debranching enzyme [Turneriella sp.]